MSIATSAHPKDLAPLGAKPAAERLPRQAKAIALLRSWGEQKDRQAINISALWGEEPNNVSLHFEVESTNCQQALQLTIDH